MYFQRLEDLRVDADKTQQEIADMLHMQREVYRRYEKAHTIFRYGLPFNLLTFITFLLIISSAAPTKTIGGADAFLAGSRTALHSKPSTQPKKTEGFPLPFFHSLTWTISRLNFAFSSVVIPTSVRSAVSYPASCKRVRSPSKLLTLFGIRK